MVGENLLRFLVSNGGSRLHRFLPETSCGFAECCRSASIIVNYSLTFALSVTLRLEIKVLTRVVRFLHAIFV